jgi:hypothetical protein
MDTQRILRQGDIILFAIDQLPEEKFSAIDREQGDIILAHGESTGHAHRIKAPITAIEYLRAENGDRYLKVNEECRLTHEEHSEAVLPAGFYVVDQQRELNFGYVRD